MSANTERIDMLLDAIEHIKADRRNEARQVLRQLIGEDGDFEDAWLWMSVAVDSLDQSSVCLDNVLRINPANFYAAGALYRIQEPQMQMERRRTRLLSYRDSAFMLMWLIIFGLMAAVTLQFASVGATLPIP
ncbi:MAG: hypothetical protein ACOYL5_06895 [Phototrophicaceae bacterium]|jgi:hypothetical protein